MDWRYLLLPLTPLYAATVRARNLMYNRGWLSSVGVEVPVVSVGNLSFGGTGKTPTTVALVRDLVRRGRHPAVLSRGYGRHSSQPHLVVGPEVAVAPELIGDEPLEMARRLPGVPIVVDGDRRRGAVEAVRRGADVLVLDDGFQHRRLARDLDIVLLDASDPWAGGHLPPLGRLREPQSQLLRAHVIVVSKLPDRWRPRFDEVAAEVAKVARGVPVLGTRLRPRRVRCEGGWQDPAVLAGARVLAFAGLGSPRGFVDLLEGGGAEVVQKVFFPDHHRYTTEDLLRVLQTASECGATPVTTAKDAVKLPADHPAWVVEVEVEPVDGHWDELWKLLPEVLQ